MKITKGKWITATIGSDHRVVTPRGHLTIARCGSGSEDRENATFIADAGTVHNETGYTPSELAEQKKALLAMCEAAERYITGGSVLAKRLRRQLNEAIASATN